MNRTVRIAWIDVLRGIGIFLVILGHRLPYYLPRNIFCWIYIFHIPLFFFISGMLASPKNSFDNQNNSWLNKRIRTLVIPYLILGLIFLVFSFTLDYLIHHPPSVSLLNLLQGLRIGPLWFLPTLFFVEFVFVSIRNVCTKEYELFFCILFATVLGCVINSFYIPKDSMKICDNLPYHLNAVLIMLPFYYCGNIFFEKRDMIMSSTKGWKLFLVLSSAMLISVCAVRFNHQVDINYGWYGRYSRFFPGAFSGITICLCISIAIERHLRNFVSPLSYLGKNTLVLLAFHTLFFKLLAYVFQKTGLNVLNYLPIFNTLLAIVCFIPVIYFFSHFFPIAIGRAQRKK